MSVGCTEGAATRSILNEFVSSLKGITTSGNGVANGTCSRGFVIRASDGRDCRADRSHLNQVSPCMWMLREENQSKLELGPRRNLLTNLLTKLGYRWSVGI